MTNNNEPDKIIEMAEPPEEEEIIELTEKVTDALPDDDEIIDLVEAADEPPVEGEKESIVAETAEPPEEDILELTEEATDTSPDDDEIIDLVDAADELPIYGEKESLVAEAAEPTEDEEIIGLTEAISDTPQEIEEIGKPIHVAAEASADADDSPGLEAEPIEEAIDFHDELDEEVGLDQALQDDFVDSLGMELDSDKADSKDLSEAVDVSDEQVETALERVIKKMFYEKIDGILVEVIEKTVTSEIERLKNILLEDAAGNEK
ncbi:MAG: hypothetical protein BBJ57_09535 [Desulfobacterales bacterium PC51MH44]|nr:MAG: hypothetical protein BBJ57_09535 [Desulfobacterales bacterium PC51MH44]